MPPRTRVGSLSIADPAAGRAEILSALESEHGDATAAAKDLKVSRKQLYNLIHRLDLTGTVRARRKSGAWGHSGGHSAPAEGRSTWVIAVGGVTLLAAIGAGAWWLGSRASRG